MLTVNNIKIYLNIGAYKWEEKIKRLVIINIRLKANNNIIDYEYLIEKINVLTNGEKFKYIEDLAKHLKDNLVSILNPQELLLEVKKPNIMKHLHYAKVSEYYKQGNE